MLCKCIYKSVDSLAWEDASWSSSCESFDRLSPAPVNIKSTIRMVLGPCCRVLHRLARVLPGTAPAGLGGKETCCCRD